MNLTDLNSDWLYLNQAKPHTTKLIQNYPDKIKHNKAIQNSKPNQSKLYQTQSIQTYVEKKPDQEQNRTNWLEDN